MFRSVAVAAAAAVGSVAAISIAEINGNRFLSPWQDKQVVGVEGLVTAVADNGIYLRSLTPDGDPATSEGLFVYDGAVGKQVRTGDVVTLDGLVKEYRSNNDHLYRTQLTSPARVAVVSSGRAVKPLVVGVDTPQPPGRDFSSLDKGGIFGVPNAAATVSAANPALEPAAYGLDFWESLAGELVTVRDAVLLGRPNRYGDVWVRGNYTVSGVNAHGGLTMLTGDANPEAIVVGSPLDGSRNPTDSKMGDHVGDVTGVVAYSFGTYRILPLTALKMVAPAASAHPAASFASTRHCGGLTVADYNAANLAPGSPHLPGVVDHIVNKLRLPDLVFLQEVQDDSGPADDGVTSANLTLSALTRGIAQASGVRYDFADVDPADNLDGGQPGGNIRCAYLYRPDSVRLHRPNPGVGGQANRVVDGPAIKFNPGLIGQADASFAATRKPLVAMWKPVTGSDKPFFTVNVHFSSKGGSTGMHGDARPPVNKGVEKRTAQMELTANFIAQILAKDARAQIITAGDFNEFTQVQPLKVFASKSGLVDLDEAAGLPEVERYTYLYDQNSEALDHIYISRSLAKGAKVEHLHLNTWQDNKGQTSDHDPSVAQLNLCGR
ncbi:uncharacterized protein UV8b_05624 [Ustilaginoidea virens]|uniref:Endonuclease/exonuclease/phosphatase domain-containing protein n=1 Tax=Ustilaginoidea virens TaxID=1159556 RepID=A0A8E5MJ29_USTVR|nr:uncharacterized protein UV8b_05624 [Ustilaginoidea virens]QUC21381.1 hypothetical protein UV8b_05624 [Ustilaginoidea virens]